MYSASILFPVSCVVVRRGDAADLKAFISVGSPAVSIEIDSELIVKTLEEGFVRHSGLEERNLHTGYLLDDSIHLDGVAL